MCAPSPSLCNFVRFQEPKQHEQLELHQAPNDLRESLDIKSVDYGLELPVDAAIQAKPKRLDQYAKQTSKFVEESTYLNLGGQTSNDNLGNVVNVSDFQEGEYADWTRAGRPETKKMWN
ncbi:uncharacterized protein [Phaseolus vulgaris]|uniref:uncharacterized protein n=1 Tax=Phaseolus vulgaris TaxID=3885 RepID=UPI0035C9C1A4